MELGVVTCTYDLGIWEAEAGGSLRVLGQPILATWYTSGQPGLKEIVSPK